MGAAIVFIGRSLERKQLAVFLIAQSQEPAFVLRFWEATIDLIRSSLSKTMQVHEERVLLASVNFVPDLAVKRLFHNSVCLIFPFKRTLQNNFYVNCWQIFDDFDDLLDFRLVELFAKWSGNRLVVLKAFFFQQWKCQDRIAKN